MKRILILMLALVMILSVFASCSPEPGQEEDTTETEQTLNTEQALKNAIAFVKDKYKVLLTTPETPADFELATTIPVGGTSYAITWTVDNSAIKVVAGEGKVTIDVPDKADAEIAYKLTAIAAAPDGTKSEPLVFNLKVPAFKINTIEEYYAAEKDALVVFEGIVTGIVSPSTGATNKCLFLQDKGGKGGVYVYGLEKDPIADLNIEIGMTVRVSGAKDIYNGTHELKPTVVEIISTEKTEVTPIDLTEAFKEAADLKAETLVGVQGALVTVKGVEITGQDASSGYYKFKLGELESYIRISGSTCAINKDDQATFIANHTAKLGYKADATGIVSVYNGAFYLVPVTVDAFANFAEITRTDAEKVEYEAENITGIPTEIKIDTVIDLPLKGTAYENVAITWTSDKAWATIDAATGKLTVPLQAEAATLKLTATLTLGENTETVEFTIAVSKKPTIAPQVVETPAVDTAYKFFLTQENNGEILYLNGEMDGYYFATTTNHEEGIDVKLETAEGGYKLYFMKDNTKTYISVIDTGEHINVVFNAETPSVWTWNTEYKTLTTVLGENTYYLGTYKTYKTFSASTIDKAATSFVGHLAVMVDSSSVSDADKIAAEKNALNVNTTMDAELALPAAGVTYTDVTITWTASIGTIADGKLTVTQTAQEQTVTLTATIKSGDKTDTKTFTITVRKVLATPEDIVNAAYELGVNEVLGEYTLTGVITEINSNWSSEFNNITVTIVVGNMTDKPIEVYRLKNKENGTGAETLAVGDTITVKGTLKNYRSSSVTEGPGKVEFDQGCTLESVVAHTHAYTDACDATCDICEATRTEIPHKWANACDAVCDCGETRVPADCVDTDPEDNACDVCGQPMKTPAELAVEHANAVLTQLGDLGYTDIFDNGEKDLLANPTTLTDVTITWSSDNAAAVVNGNKVTFTASKTEDITVTLTASIVATYNDGEEKTTTPVTKTYTVKVWADIDWATKDVTSPAADTAYKFYLIQGNLENKVLYFAGSIDGNYMLSTSIPELAADVYLEKTDGGYKFYYMVGETKTYISVNSSGKLVIDAETPTVYSWDSTYNTLTTVVGSETYYIGAFNKYETFGSSKLSYASTSFIGHLATLKDPSKITDADKVATEKESLTLSATHMDATFTLPTAGTTYNDVTITWTADIGTIADGVLTVTPTAADQTVALTATITCGETTETKSLTITVWATASDKTVAQINELGDGANIILTGVVTKINNGWNTQYSNMDVTVKDADGDTILVYRLKTQVELGDTIVVTGKVGSHNGAKQIAAGATAVITTDHSTEGCQGPATGLTAICATCGEIIAHTCVDADTNKKCDLCDADLKSYIYTKVTDASQLAVGQKLVFTYVDEKNGKYYEFGGISGTNGLAVSFDGASDTEHDNFVASHTLEVVQGSETGSFAFKLNDVYLCFNSGVSKNQLHTTATVDATSSWKITFADGVATIENVGTTGRKLQFNANSGQERFCAYTSAQKPITLWIQTVEE